MSSAPVEPFWSVPQTSGTRAVAPPKVLRVIARLNIGGPARHAVILDGGLRARGFDTLLVYGAPTPEEGSLEDLAVAAQLPARRFSDLGRRIRPWSDARALVQLTRLVFRERPDVVHTHTAKAGMLGRLAALTYNATRRGRGRCLVVHTFHGHVLTGYFGRLGSLAVRWIERALSWVTDRIVTISERQQADIVERFAIAPSHKVTVIPLGLELEPLLALESRDSGARRRFGFGTGDVTFGFVGRFAPIKDLETLLQAFSRVARASDRVRLLMVGDGERRAALEALAVSLGVADKVRFPGWQLDLAEVYGAADAVVLSSLNEGTPVALIEAMAAGLPVVATAVGGVPDVVRDGHSGILVPPREPETMARAMLMLAEDRELRERMGAVARLDVRSRFGAERLVTDVAALYVDGLRSKCNAEPRV